MEHITCYVLNFEKIIKYKKLVKYIYLKFVPLLLLQGYTHVGFFTYATFVHYQYYIDSGELYNYCHSYYVIGNSALYSSFQCNNYFY